MAVCCQKSPEAAVNFIRQLEKRFVWIVALPRNPIGQRYLSPANSACGFHHAVTLQQLRDMDMASPWCCKAVSTLSSHKPRHRRCSCATVDGSKLQHGSTNRVSKCHDLASGAGFEKT